MDIHDILDLDCRVEKQRALLVKELMKVPVVSKHYQETPEIEGLEKIIGIMCRKYNVTVISIIPTYIPDERNIYCLEGLVNVDPVRVYGISLYEVLAKTLIMFNDKIKSKIAKERKKY